MDSPNKIWVSNIHFHHLNTKKSFSFPYIHIVGHLVPEQRPPTVLNLTPRQQQDRARTHEEPLHGHDSNDATGGDLQQRGQEDGDLQDQLRLDQVARDLKGKSKELYAANIHMTKHFYKKLRRYLDFLSTPSTSVSECRIKQQLAVKISRMLSSEESRLEVSSDQSRVPGINR